MGLSTTGTAEVRTLTAALNITIGTVALPLSYYENGWRNKKASYRNWAVLLHGPWKTNVIIQVLALRQRR